MSSRRVMVFAGVGGGAHHKNQLNVLPFVSQRN